MPDLLRVERQRSHQADDFLAEACQLEQGIGRYAEFAGERIALVRSERVEVANHRTGTGCDRCSCVCTSTRPTGPFGPADRGFVPQHAGQAAGCSRCASGRAPGLRIPAEARIVSIALTDAVSDARGVLHLTPDCMTLDELEGCINGLQDELDVLRAEPRRSFDSDTGHA